MFSALRTRMSYANVVATFALVFAMSGGALAASRYLVTSTKQIKPSVLAQLKGKAGANGAAGATGPQGPAGPAGGQGPAGARGENGTAGTNGSNGQSVTSKAIPTSSATCGHLGGTELTSASGTEHVCNGQTGFTSTLPEGKTETGTWAVRDEKDAGSNVIVPISFPIPLAKGLPGGGGCSVTHRGEPLTGECHAHFINGHGKEDVEVAVGEEVEERTPVGCPGNVAEPQAESGNLCIYSDGENLVRIVGGEITSASGGGLGAGTTGALMDVSLLGAGNYAFGTWAVTG